MKEIQERVKQNIQKTIKTMVKYIFSVIILVILGISTIYSPRETGAVFTIAFTFISIVILLEKTCSFLFNKACLGIAHLLVICNITKPSQQTTINVCVV